MHVSSNRRDKTCWPVLVQLSLSVYLDLLPLGGTLTLWRVLLIHMHEHARPLLSSFSEFTRKDPVITSRSILMDCFVCDATRLRVYSVSAAREQDAPGATLLK